MPSVRFEKLNKEKREKIIKISLDEFSKNDYENVSINKIIRRAEISRGSFYTYFENKEDLFIYLIRDYIRLVYEVIKNEFDKNEKDIFKAILNTVDVGVKLELNSIYARMVVCASSLDSIFKKIAEM